MKHIIEWFSNSGHAALATALLSIVSIIIAIVSFRESKKSQYRILKIEENREKDRLNQKNKADLIASVQKERNKVECSFYLKIINKGYSEARDIDIQCDGKPVFEHPSIVRGAVKEEIRQIGPHSSFRYLLVYEGNVEPPYNVKINWKDNSGDHRYYETKLSWL